MATCERCEDRYDRERPGEVRENGEVLCDDCRDTLAEQAHEAWLESYYGGSSPQTVREQYDAAVQQRRDVRRRD